MNEIITATSALLVIDDAEPRHDAAAEADRYLGVDTDWTIIAAVPEHPQYTSGATGFAGPVLSGEEMDWLATAQLMAGDAESDWQPSLRAMP